MKRSLEPFRVVLNKAENVLVGLSTLSLFLMCIIITADALSRFLFNKPLLIAYNLTEIYLIPLVVFFTMSYAAREGAHIRVTFFEERCSPAARKVFLYFRNIVAVLFFSLITYRTAILTYHGWVNNELVTGIYNWPLYIAYAFVPIGSFVMVIRSALLTK